MTTNDEAEVANSVDYILEIGLSYWSGKTLMAAVELGLFSELAREPLDAESLRSRLRLHPRLARDFFDALVSMGLLKRENGRYHNTAVANTYLDRAKPDTYAGGMLEVANSDWYRLWDKFPKALRTGKPQSGLVRSKSGKASPYDKLYSDTERLRRFARAMQGGSLAAAAALVDRFPWKEYQTVTDIGCASGAVLAQQLRHHPHLTGIGFDLPSLGPVFQETAERDGLSDRMSFVGGDFFVDPLPPAEVVMIGHVLCNWEVETRQLLLRKAYERLPTGGAVVVYDMLIDEERQESTRALVVSLMLMLQSATASHYTGGECEAWMTDAGFKDLRIEHLAGPEWMVVGIKRS
jgi:SAM-dependent methyltransferase